MTAYHWYLPFVWTQAESEAAAKVFLPEAMPRWLVERYHSPEVIPHEQLLLFAAHVALPLCSTCYVLLTVAIQQWVRPFAKFPLFLCGL